MERTMYNFIHYSFMKFLSFKTVVEFFVYLNSTMILNDSFKRYIISKLCVICFLYIRFTLYKTKVLSLSCLPERLDTKRKYYSLCCFLLDVVTTFNTPPVRLLSRLTNPEKDVKRYVMTDISFNGLRLC